MNIWLFVKRVVVGYEFQNLFGYDVMMILYRENNGFRHETKQTSFLSTLIIFTYYHFYSHIQSSKTSIPFHPISFPLSHSFTTLLIIFTEEPWESIQRSPGIHAYRVAVITSLYSSSLLYPLLLCCLFHYHVA